MRVIIVHSRLPIISLDARDTLPVFAHCFGPFDSVEDAVAFDKENSDDCFKLMAPLLGPAVEDIKAMDDMTEGEDEVLLS